MPENLIISLFVFGAVLILISLLGGRFKIFSVAVSSNISSPFIRIIAFVLGMSAMLLALVPNMISNALTNPTALSAPLAIETLRPDPPATVTDPPSIIVSDTPVPLKPDPTGFIVSYWQNVGAGRFEISWAQLSSRFQRAMHHDDYFDYVRGLQEMQICQILPSDPVWAARDDYSAIVTVHLIFQTGAHCTTNEYDFESRLVYDGASNSWLLDKNMIK